ncbi:MAG: type IV secretory system conjugative DNA transfer family protein [Thermoprotei archaeon]
MGFDEAGNGWGLPRSCRRHMAVFGEPGQGKSSLLFTLVRDNVDNGDGFLLIDPHGDLADLVIERFGADVFLPSDGFSLDPMPLGWPRSSFLLDSLRRYYGGDWGPRLEMIMRNAMRVSSVKTVFDLRDFLENPSADGLEGDVRRFWNEVYPKLERGSESAVLNKLDKLVSDERARSFLRGNTISFLQLMDEGKRVVVSVDEGALGSDLSSFIGSLALGHVYAQGMARRGGNDFFVYVDEAHRFSWAELEIAMASLRKRRIYVTMASQSLEQFGGGTNPLSFSDTVVTFTVSPSTARALAPLFQPLDERALLSLGEHRFAVRTAADGGFSAMLYTLRQDQRMARGLSSVLGALFFLLAFLFALYAYTNVYSSYVLDLRSQESALNVMRERAEEQVALIEANGTLYALNQGPFPVTVMYSIGFDPFSYHRIGPVTLLPDQQVAVRGEGVVTALGNLFTFTSVEPWEFVEYSGSPPKAEGFFQIDQINFSLGWYGKGFPFPLGVNGSSVFASRLVYCRGGKVSFSLQGGHHELYVDGLPLISSNADWCGYLSPGLYQLSINWSPPSGWVQFNATGVYPCAVGS